MEVKLLAYTPDAIQVIYTACKTCYSSESPIDIFEDSADTKLIRQVYESGHLSTFEHVNFTFAIDRISRACSHQLVRHRHCSFSQQSQRYVKFTCPKFYEPKSIYKSSEADALYDEFLANSVSTYKKLLDLDVKAEDARMVLPNATCSNIVITLNLREFIHICGLRLCSRAQKETRDVVQGMVDEAVKAQPWLKPYLVPQCERDGFCREHKSCGRIENERKNELNQANKLLNDICNITTHVNYELGEKIANDEIRHIHKLITNYFERERKSNNA